ncbi:MAG: sugar phosphate isomerase/epimerase [Rhodobacterales bacterium]|nr:sugar phosphate isomerase/epimerase [Rhodobacterales bacterium]
MKIGFNLLLWDSHVTEDHVPILKELKATGYDGVEVPVFQGDPAHYTRLGTILADLGLGCTAVGVVPDEARNPMSLDTAHRAAGVDHLKWLVDCANELGAEVLCGPFTQPLGIFTGQGPTHEEREALAESHRVMADYATDLVLAVEPLNRFECYALNTATQAARLVDAVGNSNYGFLYDTFHANIEERDPVGIIGKTAAAITHVHISENDRGTPGKGHADIRGALRMLKAVHYDGWLTVEAFGQSLPALAAATRVWRPLFGTESEVYEEGIKLIRDGWARG